MTGQPAMLALYLPIWGATLDSDLVGVIGGRVAACTPFSDEWSNVQKTDVARLGEAHEVPIPVCLTVFVARSADESIDAGIERVGASMIDEARDAVLTLRLFRTGWFLEPELAEITFAVAENGWHIRRRPGPYRQAFIGALANESRSRYALSIADLTTTIDRRGTIAATWDLVRNQRTGPRDLSAEIAIEAFHRSYGYQSPPPSRLSSLCIALDAMLGGMSARTIGDVELSRGGFRRRAIAALSVGAEITPYGKLDLRFAYSTGVWLDQNDGGVRGARNAIAHGRRAPAWAVDDAFLERLQDVVRRLLRVFLVFASRWPSLPEAPARFGVTTDTPLVGAFNAVLESRAAGTDLADDLLDQGHP